MVRRSNLVWLIAVAVTFGTFATGETVRAATQTFTGTTSAANTNVVGTGVYNYGPPYAYAGSVTTYLINAAGSNLSGAYTGGVDELLFDGSATGTTFQIAVDGTITSTANPTAVRFNDSGGVGKNYIFAKASTTAGGGTSLGFTGGTGGATADTYSSSTFIGGTALPSSGSTSIVLESDYTGTVVLRSRANTTTVANTVGTTTINGGTLELNDAGALPTTGTNNNIPGTVTLGGGRLAININQGNEETGEGNRTPSTGQLAGTMNVVANSTLANTAINFDGTGRRQDLWGGASGVINISNGVTLNVQTGGGATIRGTIAAAGGTSATVSVGSSSTYLRLNNTTGGSANIEYDMGTSTAVLDLAATGTTNLGNLTGGNRTALRGASGGIATASVGGLGQTTSYGGQIVNSFGASSGGGPGAATNTVRHLNLTKAGGGTWTLTGTNRYSGATNVSAGELEAGNSRAFSDSASNVQANSGGTIDLNGTTQNAGKQFVLNGGSLVNNNATPVTLHTGASAHANDAASGAIFGSGTDTGVPSTTGAWTMNGNTVPTVTVSGGGGSGATAEATMQVGWLRMNAGQAGGALGAAGSGYTKAPTLTFEAPSDPNGRRATAYATINPTTGVVAGIQIVDPGWGYTEVPDLTIDNTGTGGTGFRPLLAMAVSEVRITSPGSGYATAPTVTVTNLGTVSGTTNPGTLPVAPVTTGGRGLVTLNISTNSSVGGSGDITGNAQLTGAGSITKVGAGTLVLTSSLNDYTGTTTVSAGTLLVNGVHTGGGAYTVDPGATLGGSGTINAASVGVTGTLAPGTSPGTLTINTNVTMNAASTLAMELLGTDTTIGGANNDLVTGVVDLSLDGTLVVTETVANSFLSATAGNKWRLVTFSGTLSDNGLALGSMPALTSGLQFSIEAISGQINLVVSAVPEASAFLAVGMIATGFAGLNAVRRRRRTAG